jgi:hypothetical protein
MLINGMYDIDPSKPFPLQAEPDPVDALQPTYSCPSSSSLFSSYGVGSTNPDWTAHLTASKPLFSTLDSISGIAPNNDAWHRSFDHYYDNLSARQCHAKPLPCSVNDSSRCVTQDIADTVYRLGQYEYSYIYRDNPSSLPASTSSFGVWVAELAQNIRDNIAGTSPIVYRHNVAHDGSVSRLLAVLQLDVMVWPGMGAEVVFEIWRKKGNKSKRFVRVLWGGQVMRSSSPTLGLLDMVDVEVLLAYFDGLVGAKAAKVVGLCNS